MSQLIAISCLLAMFASWLPHTHAEVEEVRSAHAATRSVGPGGVQMASDDAHDEHSSRPAIESGPCLSCRSKEDRDCDRPRVGMPELQTASAIEPDSDPAIRLPADLALGLNSPRAPPIG